MSIGLLTRVGRGVLVVAAAAMWLVVFGERRERMFTRFCMRSRELRAPSRTLRWWKLTMAASTEPRIRADSRVTAQYSRYPPQATNDDATSLYGTDGDGPRGPLVLTDAGDLYGTTQFGGSLGGIAEDSGTAFKVDSLGSFSTLVEFNYKAARIRGLIRGQDGNFYGATTNGGANGRGSVFMMTPAGQVTTIHSFVAGFPAGEGVYPNGPVIEGSDGNLYGVTGDLLQAGHFGTIFKLTHAGVLTTLHTFTGADGAYPNSLTQGSDGNIYGTASGGAGTGNYVDVGTLFKVSTSGNFQVLRYVRTLGLGNPTALIQAADGYFYGSTRSGIRVPYQYGVVFRMDTVGNVVRLHVFKGGSDGATAAAGVIQGSDGLLYGTTQFHGNGQQGTVFKMDRGLPVVQGDRNCDGVVDARDALPVMKKVAGFGGGGGGNPGGCAAVSSIIAGVDYDDVNCDEVVDLADVVAILQFGAELELKPPLPSGCPRLDNIIEE